MNTIIEVKNLSKNFNKTQVLDDISFRVERGEFIAIMGQSGSGKSTLLYNISGMDRPSFGEVNLCGIETVKLSDDKLSRVRLTQMGFVFQQSYLLKNLSLQDNIVLPGFQAGSSSREQVNQRAMELMSKTGIDQVGDHDIKKVSGGQLQRAAICRALINQPEILFADEPTGALNSSTTKEIMNIFNRINSEGTTIIMVTHDAKVAARASRVIYLVDGKLHDELKLGAFQPEEDEIANRERRLYDWLEQQGF